MELTINRVAAIVVGLALVAGLAFAITVSKTHALTLEEMVELLLENELITDEEADALLVTGDDDDMACDYNFTMNFSVGDSNPEVMDVQTFLNDQGFTVAASGAGSPGMETDYYGSLTAGAVSMFQEAYADEILTPLGLTAGTGYWGPATRDAANGMCDEMPEVPVDDDDDDDDDDDQTLSGEAELNVFEINSADDDELEEGAEDAPIAEVTMEFENGDALIKRIDVMLDGTGNDEDDPWDVFETISLWVEDEMIAEVDADSKGDYLDDDTGELRLSNVDFFATEDEEIDMIIAATLAGSIDGTDDGETWDVSVTAVRYMDADDVTTTDTSTDEIGDTVDFTIEEAGNEDEIKVKTSTSDPDSTIFVVEDDSKSGWETIFVFDIDTDDSINDILVDLFPVDVAVGTGTYDDLVDDARLVIDGTTIDSSSADVTDGAQATIDFDVDGDVEIEAGDRVSAELQLKFKALEPGNEGATVQGLVTSTNVSNIEAEGVDDVTNLSGSATGEEHQIMSEGVAVKAIDTDATLRTINNGTEDVVDFVVEFDLTAFGDEFYVGSTSAAVTYHVERDGVDVGTGSTTGATINMEDNATEEANGNYRLDEEQAATFTFEVTVNPDLTGSYRVVVDAILYSASNSGTVNDLTAYASPATDFRTPSKTVTQ